MPALPRFITAPIGQAARTVGRTYDYVTPGAGTSQLTKEGRAIVDPNVVLADSRNSGKLLFEPALKPASNGGSNPAGGGGGGGGTQQDQSAPYGGDSGNFVSSSSAQAAADAAERDATLYGIDQGLAGANDGLGRLDGQLATGLGNIDRDFQDAYGRLIGQKQIGERNYTTNKNNQLQEYTAKRNKNAAEARDWSAGAKRTLGANGAGGGSTARYAVPFEAQQMVTSANAGDQQVNNRNIVALDQAWNDDLNEFNNSEGDLRRQKTQGENDFRSKIEGSRADLINQIASLTGQRTLAAGGSYKGAMAAAAPYTSRISGILDTIDSLAATPAITERRVDLTNPTLAGYNWANPGTPAAPVQDATLAGNNVITPYEDDGQRNPILSLFGLDDQYQYA